MHPITSFHITLFQCMLAAVLALAPGAARSEASALPAETLRSLRDTHILFWTPEQQAIGYRNIRHLFPTRTIRRGERVYPLPDAEQGLDGFGYEFEGERLDVGDYMERMRTAGLIVVKDGEVVLERYTMGHDAHTRWTSFSVAKSVVSLLYGAALRDGDIASATDPVTRYEPLLAGGSYETVTISDLLSMSSGVAWNEDYSDPESDVSRTVVTTARGNAAFLEHMGSLPRAHPPGTVWNYNTGETNVAGSVLSAAVGSHLSDYLGDKIWQAFGMESDADWLLMREGDLEYGGCCISATLRDYARIGLFALGGGLDIDGEPVLADGWLDESLRPSSTAPWYGYQWWLMPGGRFYATGIFGQHIHVNSQVGIVIAMHSAWPVAVGETYRDHRTAFIDALTRYLEHGKDEQGP